MHQPDFDVIVVGASLAGCTAATLLARAGATVALLERHAEPEGYKHLCTHYIQPSALPVLKRLGLDRLIEEAGGVPNHAEVHTPYGWIGHHLGRQADGTPLHGYNISRRRLDPMLRDMALSTRGVSLMSRVVAQGVIEEAGRIVGVRASTPTGNVSLRASLVVAADGRHSEMAALAGMRAKRSPNQRHGLAAPMRHVDLQRGQTSQMWMTGPDVAYAFPNDDGVTVLAWAAPKAMLDIPREHRLEALKARIRSLPDAPQLHRAELAGDMFLVKNFPCKWRAPVGRGMALVGDAAMSLDYLSGVGCGWAFQSAAWLSDAVLPNLRRAAINPQWLDKGLQAYARQHHAELATHRFFISDFAKRLDFNWAERLLFAAGAKDVEMAHRMSRVAARVDSPMKLLQPAALLKAAWVNLRHGPAKPEGTRLSAPLPVQHSFNG
jgi:2-polyprenyl-6-methoxyphenol hydroxylase-like FAD-dependent oxidoreductase